MSELAKLIDDWRDANGQPSDASVARAIGVKRQTISSWRKRGMKTLPQSDETLRRLARHLRQDYAVVLQAVLNDIGYGINPKDSELPAHPSESDSRKSGLA